MRIGPAGMILVLLAAVVGCQPPPAALVVDASTSPPWFEDVTQARGLDFVHGAGPPPSGNVFFMPQIMGSGCALFDFDQDGRLDIFLIQNAGPNSAAVNRLYRQTADGRFEDVSAGSGLDVAGYGMGAAVGDINNDGLPDLCVTEYGRTRLFVNLGGGKFREITREAGIDNPLWGSSASFLDYDRDGWLDLVVVNYVDYDPSKPCQYGAGKPDYCHPRAFAGTIARLYRNLGRQPNGPRFDDVSLQSNIGLMPGPGLGVFCADLTGDGWTDIFVANDAAANRLWVNRRDGTFVDEALVRGAAANIHGNALANMGIAVGDMDGDGLLDLFVTHLTEETHTLWKQGPAGRFRDQTGAAGLVQPHLRGTGFGTVFADFDHDGHLDLAIVNGRVSQGTASHSSAATDFWSRYAEANHLLAGAGSARFRDISPSNAPFCGDRAISRGLACGDIDGDGAIDLLATRVAGPAKLYRNVAPNRGHWLMIRAVDPACGGRDMYGSVVTVRAGERAWTRWLNPGFSYQSSSDPRVHVGLGSAERIDAIEVLWPDGTAESFAVTGVDRMIELKKGAGQTSSRPKR